MAKILLFFCMVHVSKKKKQKKTLFFFLKKFNLRGGKSFLYRGGDGKEKGLLIHAI